jgi:hypothetical protein
MIYNIQFVPQEIHVCYKDQLVIDIKRKNHWESNETQIHLCKQNTEFQIAKTGGTYGKKCLGLTFPVYNFKLSCVVYKFFRNHSLEQKYANRNWQWLIFWTLHLFLSKLLIIRDTFMFLSVFLGLKKLCCKGNIPFTHNSGYVLERFHCYYFYL